LSLAIETRSLTKRYVHQTGLADMFARREASETVALNDVTLSISEGEVFGLLGPNGSGKTTFLKLLSTILAPSSGSAKIFGRDVTGHGRDIRSLVSLVTGEERSLYWRLTGRQNLEFFGRVYALSGASLGKKVDELLELFDLSYAERVRVGEYSTGMKQRLAVARGLMSSPKLLFLDEPTRGLDPIAAHSLLEGVRERAVRHFANTVILTTHIMREIEQLCERIAVLNRGELAYEGSVKGLRASLERQERYSFSLDGLSESTLEGLQRLPGVTSCERSLDASGSTELELVFTTDAVELDTILRRLIEDGSRIRKCMKQEQSLEEMFRAIFDGTRRSNGGGA